MRFPSFPSEIAGKVPAGLWRRYMVRFRRVPMQINGEVADGSGADEVPDILAQISCEVGEVSEVSGAGTW